MAEYGEGIELRWIHEMSQGMSFVLVPFFGHPLENKRMAGFL